MKSDTETRGEARRKTINTREVDIDRESGRVTGTRERAVTAGIEPVWGSDSHLEPGYKPFEPTKYVATGVRQYIEATGVTRRADILRWWRKESGHKGIRAAAHEATVLAIAERNPQTPEELLACPGVTEMLLDIAGAEVLDLLRKT